MPASRITFTPTASPYVYTRTNITHSACRSHQRQLQPRSIKSPIFFTHLETVTARSFHMACSNHPPCQHHQIETYAIHIASASLQPRTPKHLVALSILRCHLLIFSLNENTHVRFWASSSKHSSPLHNMSSCFSVTEFPNLSPTNRPLEDTRTTHTKTPRA